MAGSPDTEIDPRFGTEGAEATEWSTAEAQMEAAGLWWITTVRTDGRPHVTPLMAVWQDDALHFCTGPAEQKARNLESNAQVALTTGVNTQAEGLDLVLEGEAARVTDEDRLERLAEAWETRFGADWHFDVRDGAFVHGEAGESIAHVFAVAPTTAFGFRKGAVSSQTRWRFT